MTSHESWDDQMFGLSQFEVESRDIPNAIDPDFFTRLKEVEVLSRWRVGKTNKSFWGWRREYSVPMVH